MIDYNKEAAGIVKRFVTTELYRTDTPSFMVLVGGSMPIGNFREGVRVFLLTTLPDGMLYTVTWADENDTPTVRAFQEIHIKDLTPHA